MAFATFIGCNRKKEISRQETSRYDSLTHKTFYTAMTPTPAVLLTVALFWTLPASAAALIYRANEGSIEEVKASVDGLSSRLQPEA